MKLPVFSVFFALLSLTFASLSASVDNGTEAPAFTLTGLDGKEHSLADYKGKYVVLEWTNPGCPFVKKFYEAGEMQRLQKQYTGEDVVWLTINSTNPEHRDHLTADETKALGWNYQSTAVLFDPTGATGKAYGAVTTPHMFIVNPEGMVIYQGAIDSIKSASPSDISRATNYVASALAAARDGTEVSPAKTAPYGCSVKYP